MIYVYKFRKQNRKSMRLVKISIVIFLIISISGCRKEIDNPLDEWMQDPPVTPITKTIKTVVPIGYAASAVIMDMKGYKSSNIKSETQKSTNILYINTESNEYPFKFKGDNYGQMIVAYAQTDPNAALVSVFFTEMDVVTGSFTLKNVIAFPVIYDELNDKTTAVYASIDVNLGSNSNIGLDLTSEEIDQNMDKLNNNRYYNTSYVDLAVEQNAWIIDVYHHGTFDNAFDDNIKIYGGQQAVEVEDYNTESSVGALQMAMLDVSFSADCIHNPTQGFAFMQDVEVASSQTDNDIVFGHVFYEFTPDCDGRVLIDLATGNFVFSIGKELDLDLI